MKTFLLLAALAPFVLAAPGPAQLPAVLGLGTPNLLNLQDHLDPCGNTPQTKEQAYDAAYKVKNGKCPSGYWNVNNVCHLLDLAQQGAENCERVLMKIFNRSDAVQMMRRRRHWRMGWGVVLVGVAVRDICLI